MEYALLLKYRGFATFDSARQGIRRNICQWRTDCRSRRVHWRITWRVIAWQNLLTKPLVSTLRIGTIYIGYISIYVLGM